MAFIWRIISVIMSLIFSFAGIGGSYTAVPVKTDVFDYSDHGFLGQKDGASRTFYTYDEWQIFYKGLDNAKMKEYASGIDESLFDEHNLILVDIMCPASNVKVKVTAATEVGATVNLECLRVSERDMGGLTMVCYNTIFIITNKKYVSNVELDSIEDLTVPFLVEDEMYYLYKVIHTDFKPDSYDENFDKTSYVFSNYEDYADFVRNGQWELDDYIDYVDEKYFESRNLVVVVAGVNDGGDSLRISYPVENGNTLNVTCYCVSQPVLAPDVECEEAVFIRTSKNIEAVALERGDDISIPFCLNNMNPMLWR